MSRHGGGALGALFALAGLAFVAKAVLDRQDQLTAALGDAELGWLVPAAAAAAAGFLLIARAWGSLLGSLDGEAPGPIVYAWYFIGEVGKYIPGGIWAVVGRAELAARTGASRAIAYGSVAQSLVALYVTCAAMVALAAPFAVRRGWIVTALAVLVTGVFVRWRGLLLRRLGRLLGGRTVPGEHRAASAALVLRLTLAWVGIAVATLFVARALTADVNLFRVTWATWASWLLGFAAFGAPAGLGVREAVFIEVSGMATGLAVATALIARVVFMSVDALGAAVSALAVRAIGGRAS